MLNTNVIAGFKTHILKLKLMLDTLVKTNILKIQFKISLINITIKYPKIP